MSLVGVTTRRSLRVVEREARTYKAYWAALATGIFEPIFFLLSIGLGVGELVGDLPGPEGTTITYEQFVGPGMLASAAMTGALFDATFNFFVKFKYMKTFDAMLATPLSVADVARGELTWSLLRGAVYSVIFLVTMLVFGLVQSWWAVLALPMTVLIAFATAGVGLAATTYMRSFVDFDLVFLVMIPLFLFSGTFFPLERYPAALEVIVQFTPLYQGVDMCRSAVLGDMYIGLLWNVVYLVVMGWIGFRITARRLGTLLQP